MNILTRVLALGAILMSSQAFPQQHVETMPEPDHRADHDMMAGMEKMRNDMAAIPMTGDPDHDFVAMMVPHHQGAIDMAQAELKYGKDPALRRLAKDIVNAQHKEIAMMRRWQSEHPAQ